MGRDARSETNRLIHLQRLAVDPERVHLFHALRVIEAAYGEDGRLGETRRPAHDRVRLAQVPELAFPRATLERFEPPSEEAPGRLVNRFFGLWGPQGPMPLHLTEYARERMRNHRDRTLVAFGDMFIHRMMSLFFRAWASGEPAPSFDEGTRDPFSDAVAAISGYRGKPFLDRDAMPDLAKRFYAGHLANGPRHADGLVSMLRAFFGSHVTLEPFIGSWLTLEPSDRWRLGKPGRLGFDFNLGERVWSRTAKFRLRIGPLDKAGYERMLPGGGAMERLRAIVRNYLGDAFDYDIVLVLKEGEVPEMRLGEGCRLGYTSWTGERPKGRDADELQLAA
ncbi:MAG: type VI secretion system baseplate subunit TssG [Pseudomonadota bacterium]